ncbi:P22 phage major capsid protein family protein [Frigoribacterium sp. PhB118]|uniref:P22 phage major capsid protein family protein n=1 Tax=Frigoribacterium sp. PhB118 TaxID=2485175 RepID=UPI000F49C45F|nr:P22 phage major capsid protein family protein [Frigoribacterium sp. PhB118]ROS57020.1 P22 coat protein Gp5 [Frigoribacterium sp. PhB118]
MPNTLLIPAEVATVAATLVGGDLVLAGLISRDLEADFRKGAGTTVRVRVPGSVVAHRRDLHDTTSVLEVDELVEQQIDVKLNDHLYSKVTLSEGELDLDIASFAAQVLKPQTDALVKRIERYVVAVMKATPADTALAYDPANPARVFTAMRTKLRQNGVGDSAQLYAAVGSQVYADLLDGPVGSSGTTFDSPDVVRGFQVVESTRLAPTEIVGFVKPAFALVVRAPAKPDGAAYGASVSAGGFALRHIMSYDDSVAADRSLLSVFAEVTAMPLAVDREDGTVDLVEHGGAVRVLATA